MTEHLPEHAHTVNPKQLLPITLEEDLTAFVHDFDRPPEPATSQAMVEERIRDVLNDQHPPLTIQAKLRILQNLIDQPSSL